MLKYTKYSSNININININISQKIHNPTVIVTIVHVMVRIMSSAVRWTVDTERKNDTHKLQGGGGGGGGG